MEERSVAEQDAAVLFILPAEALRVELSLIGLTGPCPPKVP